MKKLLFLSIVAVSMTASSGCSWWNNMFNRGQPCNSCGPQGAYSAAPVMAAEPSTTYVSPGPVMSN